MLADVIMQIIYTLVSSIPCMIVIALVLIWVLRDYREYKKSSYYRIVHLPYISVRWNRGNAGLGRYGEYLIYKYLKKFEDTGAKFLFNVYIPKGDGKTTEIDVLMICSKGIFVFESKNFSGWIFGSEGQKNWYQTLPAGRGRSSKEEFYNPILQNRSHIKHLTVFLGEQIPMRSIIVFSERCTLKKVQVKSSDISVIKRCDVASTVSAVINQTSSNMLSEGKILELYDKLYPCTQVDAVTKAQHIANIQNDHSFQEDFQTEKTVDFASTDKPIELTGNEQLHEEPVMTVPVDVEDKEAIVFESLDSDIEEQPETKCPKCGGDLVLRSAKRGQNVGNRFYGCSNFPKCRYIQNLRQE